MDNNKGINGSGLAHVMNRARSEFAQKKCVTEVVSELNGRYNYTGVVAKPLTATGFEWRKAADTLYSVDDFVGKTAIRQEHDNIIEKKDIVYDNISIASENGSFFMNTYFVCVHPKDVGKVLNVGTEATFPEEGTYVWKRTNDFAYCYIDIVGTYKREFDSHDQMHEVFGRIDPETFQVTYLDFTFDAITKAIYLGQFIRLRCWLPDKTDDEIGTQLYASLESYSTDFGFFEFGGIIDADLGDGKQLYHYKVTLSEDNTISTEYTRVGGSSDGESASPYLLVEGEWDISDLSVTSLTPGYDVISDALDQGKDVRLLLNVHLSEDDVMPVFGGVESYRPATEQINFGAIINTDLGGESRVHHLKATLFKDGNILTDMKYLLDDSSDGQGGSEPVQENFYVDFGINLSNYTVTTETTYAEVETQVQAGKYVIGRGTYAIVSSPINIGFIPLSAYVPEQGLLMFSGFIQSNVGGTLVLISLTVHLWSTNKCDMKARVVSTTDIN